MPPQLTSSHFTLRSILSHPAAPPPLASQLAISMTAPFDSELYAVQHAEADDAPPAEDAWDHFKGRFKRGALLPRFRTLGAFDSYS